MQNIAYNLKDLTSVQWSVATRCVEYATRVQDWTRVTYPTCPVALATGHKPYPNLKGQDYTVLCALYSLVHEAQHVTRAISLS